MPQIETLALFPLSDVVLLPQASVPLYIFEPRYRQMTSQALAGDCQIGMVTVRPDVIGEMSGDPPVFEIGCLGRIAHSEQRPDGTFQILLVGERRFRILDEHPRPQDQLYRSARVELLDDREPENRDELNQLKESRHAVLELLADLVSTTREDASSDAQLAGLAALEATRLVNALTRSIRFDPIERQQLLEADSILSRVEIMKDLLHFRLAENRSMGTRSGSLPN
jgi:Lon protease-like protein